MGDLIETYKILHSLENVDKHTFFKKKTGNLRTQSETVPRASAQDISQRIVDHWNRQYDLQQA